MSNTHTRAATGRRGREDFGAAGRKSQGLSRSRQVLLGEPGLVYTGGTSCYLERRLLQCWAIAAVYPGLSYLALPFHAKGRSKTVQKPHTWQQGERVGAVERQRLRWWNIP